jgi:hypothetical protein
MTRVNAADSLSATADSLDPDMPPVYRRIDPTV